jgi:hypothetical protein
MPSANYPNHLTIIHKTALFLTNHQLLQTKKINPENLLKITDFPDSHF